MSATTLTSQATAFISPWESCVLSAYQDPGGVWTVGWGSTVMPDGSAVAAGATITQAQADQMLADAVSQVLDTVQSAFTTQFTGPQTVALTDFGYNCGIAAVTTANIGAALTAGDFPTALAHMGLWIHDANGEVLEDLVRRRTAEIILFLGGTVPPMVA